MEKCESKLKVVVTYLIVLSVLGTALMVAMLVYPFIAFEPTNDIFYEILLILLLGPFVAWGAITTIVRCQTAILDETGIVFRSPMREIARIQWTDIVKADVQNISVMSSRAGDHCEKYIILYTASDQKAGYGGHNRRNKPPWKIKCNKKSVETIKGFLERYSNMKPNVIYRAFKNM